MFSFIDSHLLATKITVGGGRVTDAAAADDASEDADVSMGVLSRGLVPNRRRNHFAKCSSSVVTPSRPSYRSNTISASRNAASVWPNIASYIIIHPLLGTFAQDVDAWQILPVVVH